MTQASRANHGASTRVRILETAIAHFTEHGYEGTPLRAISDELGVTKAALYYYFGSKESLLLEIISPALDAVDEILKAVETRPRREGWKREVIEAYTDVLIEHLPVVRILARDMHVAMQPGIAERIDDHQARLQALLTGDEADFEERARVFGAITVVQRSLLGHRGQPLVSEESTSPIPLRQLAICMAMQLLTDRCN